MLKFLAKFFIVTVCCSVFIIKQASSGNCDQGKYGSWGHDCETCPSGCFCPGGNNQNCSIVHGLIRGYCADGSKPWNWGDGERCAINDTSGYVHRCPDDYSESDEGSVFIYDCYNDNHEYYPIECDVGTYIKPDTYNCISCAELSGDYYCPGGVYSKLGGGNEPCPVGHTCKDGVATPCPAGTYKSNTGAGSCTRCTSQTYANIEHTQCYDCPDGLLCKNGKIYNCPEGYYCEDGKKYSCSLGSKPYRKDIMYQKSEATCNAMVANAQCFNGKQGAELEGAKFCVPCPAGTYGTLKTEKDDTTDEVVDSYFTCEECPAGTANPNTGATSIDACEQCPAGQDDAPVGSATCSGCKVNEYMKKTTDGSPNECKTCPDKYGKTNDECVDDECNNICQICPIGSHSENGVCVECDETQRYYTDSDGQTSCKRCPVGQSPKYKFDDNTLEINGFDGCLKDCPAGYIAEKETVTGENNETTELQYCARLCPGGYGWDKNTSECKPCPEGTYRSATDNIHAVCQTCGTDTYSFGTGKESCMKCPIGSCCIFTESPKSAYAYACNKGTYGDISGLVCTDDVPGQCFSCNIGWTTRGKGAKSEDECNIHSVNEYCWTVNNAEVCFSWPKDINIYENDVEEQNIQFQ